MTRIEADELLIDATPFLNQQIVIYRNTYTFIEIGTLVGTGENNKLSFRVSGYLISDQGKKKIMPLSEIVRLFRNQSENKP